MAGTDPFYSVDPADPDVYHNCSRCGLGRDIPARHVLMGKGGRRQCSRCAYLTRRRPLKLPGAVLRSLARG